MDSASTTTRDARLDFRLSQEHKRLIELAATMAGQTLSDFAISNLVQLARRTIDAATETRLSIRDREVFLGMLEAPVRPNAALKRAAERYKKRRV